MSSAASSSSSSSATLSNVVSSLVRASMGASVPASVSDEDLDKAVMELLMKEARSKDDKYNSAAGIRAFLESQPVGTKTNKRFLTSIIKSTDEHNRAVIRSQLLGAAAVQTQREEAEREDKRRRATQAAETVRKRRERSWERRGDDEAWDAWRPEDDKRPRSSKRRRSRSRDRDEERHHRRRSRSPRRSSKRDADKDKDKDKERSHRSRRRHRSRSCSPRRDDGDESHRDKRERERTSRHDDRHESRRGRRHHSPSPPRSLEDEDDGGSGPIEAEDVTLASTSSKPAHSPSPGPPEPPRPPEPTPPAPERARKSRASPAPARHKKERPPSPSGPRPPPPPPLPPIYSKMDKYFDPNYDPRMDVELPAIPSTGLLVGDHYDGWESMLELMRARREDKARAKWENKHGKSNTGSSSVGTASAPSALDITYSKRGATREWDMGKTLD